MGVLVSLTRETALRLFYRTFYSTLPLPVFLFSEENTSRDPCRIPRQLKEKEKTSCAEYVLSTMHNEDICEHLNQHFFEQSCE